MKENSQYKRVYIDVAQWGAPTRYAIINIDLILGLRKFQPKLSDLAKDILLYICMVNDNTNESRRNPIALSYGDIAKLFNCNIRSAQTAIDVLVKNNLLTIEKKGVGRGKTQYLPNVEKLHLIIKKQSLNGVV